jgi:hypothetical protein
MSAQPNLSSSDIIAISSIVIAVLALFATWWQAWLTHKHNRLVVRPFLAWCHDRNHGQNCLEVVFSLSNQGIGPAIVRERYFYLDGKHFKNQSDKSDVECLVDELLPLEWKCWIKEQGLPGLNHAIPAGSSFVIAHLVFDESVLNNASQLDEILKRVRFCVVYEDLYGKRSVLHYA